MKTITLYHADGIKDLSELMKIVRREFPNTPFEGIKVEFGIVSIRFNAEDPKPCRARRIFKSEMRS